MARAGRLVETAEAVLVAAALALAFKGFVFQIYHVPSASMEDTVLTGDYVLVNKFAYGAHEGPWARVLPYRDLTRGDVVVFRYPPDPERDFVKRVVGLPGDWVTVEAKSLAVNEEVVTEPYAVHRDARTYGTDAPPSLAKRDSFGPVRVPEGRFFALGDNRDESRDSRFWGSVPLAHLEGRAVAVLWSVRDGPRSFSGRGAALRRLIDTALHFLSRTRWERSFHAIH
ncbi:MAG: signal peptidase I [Thermoanaerobaculia bacterium]|nr:signal peptidase I [Thermoanaerobaculia bacterium]